MRTLIFLGLLGACVALAIIDCRDRSDHRKVAIHAACGLVIGYILWKIIVRAGVFNNW